MEKITLVCTSHNPDMNLFQKMLDSSYSKQGQLFDERIIHWNTKLIRKSDSQGERITPIPQHYSIPDAYNYLIKNLVETEWICCMCDDDYFYPEGLQAMINEIRENPACGVAHFKFHISGYMPKEDFRGQIYKRIKGKTEYDLWESKLITSNTFDRHNRLPAASFFRKRAWEMVGGFQGDKCHDWDLWKRMAKAGIEFKYFPHLVYNHVRRENSAWHKQNKIK